jgi:transposase-like protein
MVGRYESVSMSIYGRVIPRGEQVARLGVALSPPARQRLRWFDYYGAHGRNARLTCRHFGISPQTFYRWRRRYHSGHLQTLEGASRRPRRVRQPTASPELVEAVLALRQLYPRWGKDKLVVLLRRHGRTVSTSMVGRILKRLKDRGVLVEPVRGWLVGTRRAWPRPSARRKPKTYQVQAPGDLVQVDTLDVRPVADVVVKHFGAAMSSPGGMCWKRTSAPPATRPRPSYRRSPRGCRFP